MSTVPFDTYIDELADTFEQSAPKTTSFCDECAGYDQCEFTSRATGRENAA